MSDNDKNSPPAERGEWPPKASPGSAETPSTGDLVPGPVSDEARASANGDDATSSSATDRELAEERAAGRHQS
jgi:hypothetical protein